MARPLALLEEVTPSSPYAHGQVLSHIRETVERATGPSPHTMPTYDLYLLVQRWAQTPEYRGLIQDILKARLALPPPCNYKAVMLLQALPVSSDIALLDQLKPLTADQTPTDLMTHLATQIYQAATAENAQRAREASAKLVQWRWDVWCERYGRPDSDWAPGPADPEWGMWAVYPVDRDTWWTLPKVEGHR